jgi:hypothetical protein
MSAQNGAGQELSINREAVDDAKKGGVAETTRAAEIVIKKYSIKYTQIDN